MRWWLTTLTLTTAIVASGIQASAQPLTIWWLSFVVNGSAQVPIRINPATGLVDLDNGVFVDSRFPSLSADGRQVVFQVGSGLNAQVWQAVWDAANGRWQVNFAPIPQTDPPQPLVGVRPVISADGNHIAFASVQDYGFGNNNRWQIYVLDRLQNRIVPISFLWQDTDGDGMRDTFVPSLGNCIPVSISANGRIVVFLVEWLPDDDLANPNHQPADPLFGDHPPLQQESRLYIVDTDGDGRHELVPIPPTNQPYKWLVLIHDRDADGNGIYDETSIGATITFVGSYDEPQIDNDGDNRLNEEPIDGIDNDNDGRVDEDPPEFAPPAAFAVSANGRFIAFATTYDNDGDGQIDEDPIDTSDNDGDQRTDEDPVDEQWRIIVLDWQQGLALVIDNAYMPVLSDDGTYIAYLTPTQIDNDGDGRLNEDPIDFDPNGSPIDNDQDGLANEDPPETYLQTSMDLVVRQLIDPTTGQPPAQVREIRLSGLQLPTQFGTADGSAGWGYSDWWGAVTVAVDPINPNVVYAAFHAWSTDLVDLTLVRSDLVVDGNANAPRLKFYQGVPNIFLARFNFTDFDTNPQAPNRIQLWRLTEWTDQQQMDKRRGLPVSMEPVIGPQTQYRLTLAPNLLPTISFANPDPNDPRLWRLFVAFQSLAPFDQQNDTNGLWDIYLADVLLP